MNFDDLNKFIPYVTEGKKHSLTTLLPYPGIQIKQPGKYWEKSSPQGGDFVIEVTDANVGWKNRKFTHDELFADIFEKCSNYNSRVFMQEVFAPALAEVVVNKADPDDYEFVDYDYPSFATDRSLLPSTLLQTSQVLALAEHRRYEKFEASGGGRFLPARFALGIIEGLWSAHEASLVVFQGKPGLEKLIAMKGAIPELKDLCGE